MPLGEDSYPFLDESGKTMVMDPATGETYSVDPNGQVMTPGGVEIPPWGAPTPQQPRGATPTPQQTPGVPSSNVQPGLSAQQWEANYTLLVAEAKRLRELLNTVTQPQARASIDQAIQALQQGTYNSQMQARESQSAMTGKIPRWLPQPPRFQPGGYQQYQTPPEAGSGGAEGPDTTYDTVNGPKTVAQMEQELKTAGWPGNEPVPPAYARTTGGPVTPRGR